MYSSIAKKNVLLVKPFLEYLAVTEKKLELAKNHKNTRNISLAQLTIAVLAHPRHYLMIQRKVTITNANCPELLCSRWRKSFLTPVGNQSMHWSVRSAYHYMALASCKCFNIHTIIIQPLLKLATAIFSLSAGLNSTAWLYAE